MCDINLLEFNLQNTAESVPTANCNQKAFRNYRHSNLIYFAQEKQKEDYLFISNKYCNCVKVANIATVLSLKSFLK